MPQFHRLALSLLLLLAIGQLSASQQPQGSNTASNQEGLPVTSVEVQKACGACHALDDKQRMTRISYRRSTPEGWELTIKRMMALNGVNLTPETARGVLKYLADRHGLAPEEARPAAFESERRLIEYTYTADKDTNDLCMRCHSMGRVISERRTPEEWTLLLSMHRGYYPLIDGNSGGFRRAGPPQTEPGPDGRAPDNRHPMEKALAHLPKVFPLNTPEWAAWSAVMRPPVLAGRWAVIGHEPGKGPVYGQVTISAEPGQPDVFVTETRYANARTGVSVTRKGRAIIYTGFQWRGRSTDDTGTWREVTLIGRDWKEMSGRWFTGAYDEIGVDVTLTRVVNDPVVLGTSVSALKAPSSAQAVRIYGANFPPRVEPSAISFGQGVTISRVVSASPDAIDVEVAVAPNAPVGPRDVSVASATRPSALAVYDKMDGIKIRPQAGMARIGGEVFPKQLQQFEAVAFHNGPDGKPDTRDDVNLGLVNVQWSLEEYAATFDDDDLRFVGALDANGLFVPAADGPNPARRGNRNNVGDVWVVATFTPQGSERPLRARAHLLVTVPLYMNWAPTQVWK